MRRKDPLILGAGPAGCAAAITMARSGAAPLLVDRDAEVGDALCGGFLSWKTAERLASLGISPAAFGAHSVNRLLLFGTGRPVEMQLPQPCWGLSRRTLDDALRTRAIEEGADFEVATIRRIDGLKVTAQDGEWEVESLFLATGKHDVRGFARPRASDDPALGIRVRLSPSSSLRRTLAGRIELHLFDGGYAGIVMQEGDSMNLCMAVRKSLLARHDGNLRALLNSLARQHGHFALRLDGDWREAHIDTIGAVPYGWRTAETLSGVFRLGDQSAVIPSLAGEGIDIALASGIQAANAWLAGGAAAATEFQRQFHREAQQPLRWAAAAWKLGESPALTGPALTLARFAPRALRGLMEATRLP